MIRTVFAAVLALALGLTQAAAQQSFGLIDQGTVLGNSTAAARTPTQTAVPALFDRALCSTVGAILVRSTTGWLCGSIASPLTVNNGTGAVSLTTPLPIANGGTNAITALAARAATGLDVEAFTGRGDAIYTILATDRVVGTNAALTASRAWTLPAANAVNAGGMIIVADFQGTVTGVNTIVITRAGADTINGGTTVTISAANGAYALFSDGISKWSAQAIGASAVAAVSSLNQQTGALVLFTPPQGRVTVSTGTPVVTSTVTAATSVFYTAYVGKNVPIYNGTAVAQYQICAANTSGACQLTITLGANWTLNTNYDVFIGLDTGTVRACTGPAWTSATVRGTGAGTTQLSQLDGLQTNTVSMTCRYNNTTTFTCAVNQCTYVGSFRTTAAGQVDYIFGGTASGGTAAVLNVCNYYNRVMTTPTVADNGVGYAYSTGTTRQARASAGNQITFLNCFQEESISVNYYQQMSTAAVSGAFGRFGIGVDSTSAFGFGSVICNTVAAVINFCEQGLSTLIYPGLGSHFVAGIERGDGTNNTTYDSDGTSLGNSATLKIQINN